MRDECIAAVEDALGRSITTQEAKDIETRIASAMRLNARENPEEVRAMAPKERLIAGAQLAAKQLKEEAQKKKQRVLLTIQAKDALDRHLAKMKEGGMLGLDGLKRTLVFVADGKSDFLSMESRHNAIKADTIGQLIKTFESVNPKFAGFFTNAEAEKLLIKAMFGEATGNAEIDAGGKAWLDTAESLRTMFNNAGGQIGKLVNWAIPQHHSQLRVLKAGQEKWVSDIIPLLDRSAYVEDDGSLMSNNALTSFMREAWDTIATAGVNKIEPGARQGTGGVANRHADHRAIHFKDADSYIAYQEAYGENHLWGIIEGHVNSMTKDIASVLTYGPNPDHMFNLLREQEFTQSIRGDIKHQTRIKRLNKTLDGLYEYATGKTTSIVSETLAHNFDTLRSWLIASRLGSAVITSLSDEATLRITAKLNNLPQMQLTLNQLDTLNVANRTEENLANRAGLGIDTFLGTLNRWGHDELGPSFSSKTASTVMRLSGMNAADGARRRAFGVTYMSALGEMVRKYDTLADLDPVDHRILLSKGITEADWAAWKAADLEDWGRGNGVLTPESIRRIPDAQMEAVVKAEAARLQADLNQKIAGIQKMGAMTPEAKAQAISDWSAQYAQQLRGLPTALRDGAVQRLLGVILEETDMAIIRPGVNDRFVAGAGGERGTWKGELTRSFFLFKSFPLAMISRHFVRGISMPGTTGKAVYIASLLAATTVAGAISQTVNDLLSGRDIKNYGPGSEHPWKNAIGAMLKGGSLGIYGDFLFADATQGGGNSPLGAMMGPTWGLAEQAINLTRGNIGQAAQGKDTNFGAEATRFVKGNTPGASLWYLKGALDHLVFQRLQEYFSPGYLQNMENRSRNQYGQEFYWRPGEALPERAPEISH